MAKMLQKFLIFKQRSSLDYTAENGSHSKKFDRQKRAQPSSYDKNAFSSSLHTKQSVTSKAANYCYL